jgi:hypothetical protein
MRQWFLLTILCFATCLSGCSVASSPNYGELGLVQVSGVVTLDGEPVPGARVQFRTTEDGTYSQGVTDDKGRYSLMFDSETAGIIPGKKQVVVLGRGASSEESSDDESNQGQGNISEETAKVTIPKCYGSESKIEVEVTGSDSSFNLELRSDCSTVSR